MEKFDKKMTNKILPKFNNAKEWSDLMTIMKKMKENFQKYEHLNMTLLSEKVTLAKRLAQCLNVKVPGGLHEMALEVYGMLFENIKKNNNNLVGEYLGLFSSGLFPFFTYASAHNKMLFLENIIKKHYLTLEKDEFQLALTGILVSILPGIEEQNELMQKEIKDIFLESRKIIEDSCFFGAIWSIILRTQRLRLVCIRYLTDAIPPYKVIEDDPEQREDIINRFYPNLPILVLNAMKALIEESGLHTQRFAMDFIITHFPVYNNLLDENNKIQLLTSGLKLLIKNDYSTTRRLLMFLLGPNQEDDIEMGDPNIKYMIELLTKALKEIFSKNVNNLNEKHITNAIKLIAQLFMQQVKLGEYILVYVSMDMINLVEAFWSENSSSVANDSVKKIQNFFNYDPNYMDSLWNSLGKNLSLIVNNNHEGEDSDVFLNEINSVIRILKFCLINVQLYSIDKKIKYYIPIISSLLKAVQLFKVESCENLDEIKPLIILALKFTKSLQAGCEEYNLGKSSLLTSLSLQHSNKKNVFATGIKFSCQKCNSMQFILKYSEQNYGLIERLMENILLYHSVYITICQTIYSNVELSRQNITIFTQATELAMLVEEYVTSDQVPEWVYYLEKVLFCENIDLSLEGIFYLIDLFMINSENPIYDNIKSFLRNEEISSEIIDESLLEDLVHQTHVRKNCIELAMARLWILVEDQNHQKPVIDLLIKFYTADQNVFQNTISNTFAINDLDQNVNAIKKFTQFWKLTSEFYPDLIFFENGECIFKMLDFLDHEHPLLRHLSKSWLSEAKNQFCKIIDPLLKVLLDKDTSWYISFQKQLYFTKEYDNRRIIEAFRKLKNIIINVPDIAISYFVGEQVTQSLRDMDVIGKELQSVSKAITISHYLDLLVSISLRFIQGKFIESISMSFYRENFSVNAASCEFLEFLLSFIEPKSQVMNIAKVISEPVLSILHETLMTNDEVMQVQLLNLLKVLLVNTKDEHKNYEDDAKAIFSSKKFHDCIINGIQINYIFVRGYFINFVESCLPIFSNILDQEPNLEIAKRLINTTTDFLVSRVKYSTIPNKNPKKVSSMGLGEGSKYSILKNYLEEYREFKHLDENDLLVITKGLKNILFHFLNITSPVLSTGSVNWTEVKKDMLLKGTASYSFFSYFYRSNNGNNANSQMNNSTIGTEIIEILQDVFASFCACWINGSDTFMSKDYCLCDNGLLSTSNEDRTFQNNKNGTLGDTDVQLKNQIVLILLNIFIKNPFDFMKNFFGLFQSENNRYIVNDKQYKLSMIEMLISLDIPTELFLYAVNKIIDVSKIKEIKRSKVRLKDMYPFYLNKEQCSYEAKLCQLIYAFINYNTNLRVDRSLVEIWNEMINFINIMKDSKSSCTLFWLYELVNLLLYRLPIRESCNDATIKKNLPLLIIDLFNKILDISITNKYDSLFEESTQLITPLPPSIYENVAYEVYGNNISKNELNPKGTVVTSIISTISQFHNESFPGSPSPKKYKKQESLISFEDNNKYKNDKSKPSNEQIIRPDDESTNQFFCLVNEYLENKTIIKNDDLIVAYRNIGFITLKSLFYPTMKNIFSQEKMVPYFQLLIKNLISIMNEKVSFNKIYVDMSTEFLHSLILNASTITYGSCKQLIMDFFLEPEFFTMSLHCLRLWKDIICEFSHAYQDIINDLMDKMNQGGFFAKNTDKFNIKAMRRISFIIYSSPKDTYANKLDMILEKVKEMITKYSENPALESEIFLMIRIMFLRFSHENLIEMIRNLWPLIFSEIVNVIKSKRKNSSMELNLSGFKLIELLSVSNMGEFVLYQWIFFLDVFQVTEIDPSNEIGLLMNIVKNNLKGYKPFAYDMAKNWNANSDLIENYHKGIWNDFEKRKLMITVQKINSQEELGVLISRVFIYIALMNNFRNEIDYDAVEEVIEKDFLHNE